MRLAVAIGIIGAVLASPAVAQTDPWIERVSKDCGATQYYDSPEDYALMRKQILTQAETDAEFRKRVKEKGQSRIWCIEGHERGLSPARKQQLKPQIDQLKADAAKYYDDAFSKARAAFEAAPAKYTFLGGKRFNDDYSVAQLKGILKAFKEMKTLQQTCGTFDYSMPWMDNKVLRRRQDERLRYGRCVEAYRKGVDGDPKILGLIKFQIATKETAALAPYACSKWKVKDCIKDREWKAFAAVANEKNLAFVERMDKVRSEETWTKTRDAIERTNKWQRDLNAAVDAYNKSVRGY